MSRVLGYRTLVPTTGINSYLYHPMVSSVHLCCHDFIAMSVETLRASEIDMTLGAFTLPLLISNAGHSGIRDNELADQKPKEVALDSQDSQIYFKHPSNLSKS